MKEAWAIDKKREDVIRMTKRPDTVLNTLQSIWSDINIFNTADLALSLVRRKPLLKKMNITACLDFVTNLKALRRKLWSEDTKINLNVLNVCCKPNITQMQLLYPYHHALELLCSRMNCKTVWSIVIYEVRYYSGMIILKCVEFVILMGECFKVKASKASCCPRLLYKTC